MAARHDPAQRARTLGAAKRRAEIFEYVKAGASYRDIATRFGVSHVQIYRDVRRVLSDLQHTAVRDLELYRQLELCRLDQLLQGLWPQAVVGNLGAVALALRIGERRAKLIGLDAPPVIDIEPQLRAIAVQEGLNPEEVVSEAQRLLTAR